MNVQDVKREVAETYGLPIIGTGDYFSNKAEAKAMTGELVELYELLKGIVREHDKLADSTNHHDLRINGKRGRKAEVAEVTTADDVMARLVA